MRNFFHPLVFLNLGVVIILVALSLLPTRTVTQPSEAVGQQTSVFQSDKTVSLFQKQNEILGQQTKILEEQNRILQRIASELEEMNRRNPRSTVR